MPAGSGAAISHGTPAPAAPDPTVHQRRPRSEQYMRSGSPSSHRHISPPCIVARLGSTVTAVPASNVTPEQPGPLIALPSLTSSSSGSSPRVAWCRLPPAARGLPDPQGAHGHPRRVCRPPGYSRAVRAGSQRGRKLEASQHRQDRQHGHHQRPTLPVGSRSWRGSRWTRTLLRDVSGLAVRGARVRGNQFSLETQ